MYTFEMMQRYYVDNLKILKHIRNKSPFFIGRFSCGNEVDSVGLAIHGNLLESNAGIRCSTSESFQDYVTTCRHAFSICTLICTWDCYCRSRGQEALLKQVISSSCERAYARGLWAYYFLEQENWMNELNGKSILIISPFVESIKQQLRNASKIFSGRHYQWFQDCTFSFVKPPVTLAGNHGGKDWREHYQDFKERILQSQAGSDFEVALVSCGGYGIPICGFIFEELERSAIYVGGALQIFFGILGGRWEIEEKEILDRYKNEYWIRPGREEKPENFSSIEGGCYW